MGEDFVDEVEILALARRLLLQIDQIRGRIIEPPRQQRRQLQGDQLMFSKLFYYVAQVLNVPLPEVYLVEDNKPGDIQLANAIDSIGDSRCSASGCWNSQAVPTRRATAGWLDEAAASGSR